LKKLIFSSLTLFFLNACQTHFPIVSENKLSEAAACQENIERIELADIDYLLYANQMIDSMMHSNNVQKETVNSRMRIYLSPVSRNSDDVDMNILNTSIKNRILRSGLFIVTEDMKSADFQLSGAFKEIKQAADTYSCIGKYEEFSMQLRSSRTDTILWSEKKQFN